jgi:predicted Zn-dependent protease
MPTEVSAAIENTKPARDSFREAREKLFPPLGNKLLAQASDALAQGQIDAAESLVSGFLEKKPRDPAALNLMADIARRAQRFEEAENLLSRCVELAPDSAGYRFNFAVILRRREKYDDALAQLDVLLARDPQNPLFCDQKATVLALLGRQAEALPYRKALAEEYPHLADVWLAYGDVLRGAGSVDECIDAYRRTIACDPDSSAGYLRLADLKTYKFAPLETGQMEKLLSRPGLPAEERADVHSALGEAYDDAEQYAKAFAHYAKGNALRRMGIVFDPQRLATHRVNCEAIFTREFFEARKGWGCPSRAPIFIVGMPRSGSTLVEQILSSHSAIEGIGERPDFDLVVGRLLSRREAGRPEHEFWISGWFEFRAGLVEALPRALETMSSAEVRSIGEDYLESVRTKRTTDRPFMADKGLRNFGYVGLICLALPNARFIDVRRHPLDCGWSCFRSHFPGSQPFANRLGDIGHHYANYVRLMKHFDEVLPGRVHRLVYENLVADPEQEIRRLFDYLELPFEEQCLRFHENRRIVRTLSAQQVRTPLYRSGVGQWLPYDEWLGPLKSALAETLPEYPYQSD